ncbi:phenylpyruvate tautomerase MIF-related protein [Methylocaldum sp.]|uniref:phenylpyruvate tautomerase MIF-related protein n=1 Tax=Methylocaldum sp. TaxID=1969727 RepID=UPI002D48225D|nr:phenylpyruvate tautomerase MIF-related protein [Methylocaldum sp.]HYE34890.1 phenylpyruvate tautomerase MIF-related protein [Methylocaldum sp.]
MPYLTMQINRPVAPDQRESLLVAASRLLAKELGKPEAYVMVSLNGDVPMLFAGTSEPAAYVELKSIGLPAVQTKSLSRTICGLLEQQLKISPARVYIEFTDIKGSHWGWNGGTF